MTDRDLLIAAAHALISTRTQAHSVEYLGAYVWITNDELDIREPFNPLEDDGQAFRLAVDLAIFDSQHFQDECCDLLCGHYGSHRRLIVELAAKGVSG